MTGTSLSRRVLDLCDEIDRELAWIGQDPPVSMADNLANLRLAARQLRSACEVRIKASEHERARRSAPAAGSVMGQGRPHD